MSPRYLVSWVIYSDNLNFLYNTPQRRYSLNELKLGVASNWSCHSCAGVLLSRNPVPEYEHLGPIELGGEPVADWRKRTLSAAYGGGLFSGVFACVKCFFPSWNFHFGRPKTNFSGFKKWKLCHWGPLTYLLARIFLSFSFLFFPSFLLGGPVIFCWGPWEQYFKGALSAAADTADS